MALVACWALAASAHTSDLMGWHTPPMTIPEGSIVLDTVPDNAAEASIHARLSVRPGGCWRLVWDRADTARYCVAEVRTTPAASVYSGSVRVVARCVDGASVSVIGEIEMPFEDEFFSVRLLSSEGSTRIYVGSRDHQTLAVLPALMRGGEVRLETDGSAKAQMLHASHRDRWRPQRSQWPSPEALLHHLSASKDSLEGVWEYMDRDVDQAMAQLGGKYVLAVVRSPEGGAYDVIYLDGADVGKGVWLPLDIKGCLAPTAFVGDYDLQWIDAEGVVLTDDNNALLSADNAVLTLRFPVYKSQIRFRRVRSGVPSRHLSVQ